MRQRNVFTWDTCSPARHTSHRNRRAGTRKRFLLEYHDWIRGASEHRLTVTSVFEGEEAQLQWLPDSTPGSLAASLAATPRTVSWSQVADLTPRDASVGGLTDRSSYSRSGSDVGNLSRKNSSSNLLAKATAFFAASPRKDRPSPGKDRSGAPPPPPKPPVLKPSSSSSSNAGAAGSKGTGSPFKTFIRALTPGRRKSSSNNAGER